MYPAIHRHLLQSVGLSQSARSMQLLLTQVVVYPQLEIIRDRTSLGGTPYNNAQLRPTYEEFAKEKLLLDGYW